MKAEWREPSGESCESLHRAACAAPLSLVGVRLQTRTFLKQPIGRTVGIEF